MAVTAAPVLFGPTDRLTDSRRRCLQLMFIDLLEHLSLYYSPLEIARNDVTHHRGEWAIIFTQMEMDLVK